MNSNLQEDVTYLATRFRRIIENCQPDELPQIPSIARFPRGTCGDASDLLAMYLNENGIEDIQYVWGKKGQQTHGWLEVGGLIVDITADQFKEIEKPVTVSSDRAFHNRFQGQQKRNADFELFHESQVTRLTEAYRIILSKGDEL